MRKLTSLALTVSILAAPLTTFGFTDVSNDNAYYAAVESLKNLGIISGYDDDTFRPNNSVNRAEALKMILTSSGTTVGEYNGTDAIGFTDVAPSAWFTKFLIKGKNMGVVSGNADGTFAPSRTVNKAEFLKMLLNSFSVDLSKHQGKTSLSADTTDGQWFLPYLSYAKTVGLISPTLENKLTPGQELTRGECAEIIYKMILIQKGGDAQKLLGIAEANLVSALVSLNNNDPESAILSANSAVFYTEQVLAEKADSTVAQGANHIAKAFRSLCLAYQSGVEKDYDSLKAKVTEAKDFAAQAKAVSESFSTLQTKINEIGDTLLSQVE